MSNYFKSGGIAVNRFRPSYHFLPLLLLKESASELGAQFL